MHLNHEKSWSYVKKIKQLDAKDRLEVAEKYFNEITNSAQFVEILSLLSNEEKLPFAKKHPEGVGEELAAVLELLPEDARLAYAKSYDFSKQKLYDFQIAKIVEVLGVIDLEFITPYVSLLGSSFGEITSCLPPKDRLAFATQYFSIKHHQNAFLKTFEALFPEDRFNFALSHLPVFTIPQDALDVLEGLPEKQRQDFAKHFDSNSFGRIKMDAYFSGIDTFLTYLTPERRLHFLMPYCNKLSIQDFDKCIQILDLKERHALASLYNRYSNFHPLWIFIILCRLPEENRVPFLTNHVDCIEKGYHAQIFLFALENQGISWDQLKDAQKEALLEKTIDAVFKSSIPVENMSKEKLKLYYTQAVNITHQNENLERFGFFESAKIPKEKAFAEEISPLNESLLSGFIGFDKT